MASGEVLVERDHEIGIIDSSLKSCLEFRGQFLFIEGAPGTGKSSLLDAVQERSENAGLLVLRARGNRFEANYSYGVVRQFFEHLLTTMDADERAQVLRGPGGLAEPLFTYCAGRVMPGQEPDEQQSFLHGLYWMCANLAETRPLALLLDDIRWADSASLHFLRYLSSRLDDRPILLAVTAEPGPAAHPVEIIPAIIASASARHLRLEPLSAAGVSRCLASAFGGEPGSEMVRACHEATGGVPFYVWELLGALAAQRRRGQDLTPREVLSTTSRKVMRRVHAQLAGLPRPARALIEAVAVLGDEADVFHAVAVAELDDAAVAEGLGELVDAGLLHPGLPPRFVHAIIRAAIYQSLPPSARSAAHARAARALAGTEAPVREIAGHLLHAPAAGDAKTVAVLGAAAAKALEEGENTTAVTYLRRAMQEPPRPQDMSATLAQLGRAELRERMPEALDHLSQALALAPDPVSRGRIGLDLGAALSAASRSEEAVALLERLRRETEEDDQELSAMIGTALMSMAQRVPHLRPIAKRELLRLESLGFQYEASAQFVKAHRAADALRKGASAQQVAELAEEAAGKANICYLHDIGVHASCLTALVLAYCDRLAEAEGLLTRVKGEAESRGLSLATDAIRSMRAWVRFQRGMLREAEQESVEVIEDVRQLSDMAGEAATFAVAALAETLIARGDPARAETVLNEYRCSADMERSAMFAPVLLARGRLQAMSGRMEAGLRDVADACALMENWGVHHPALLHASEATILLAKAGRMPEARSRAAQNLDSARRFGAPRVLAAALRAAGHAATDHDGVRYFEQALEILSGTSARLEYAAALVDLGAALRAQHRLHPARERLKEGVEIAENCGATALVNAAREELTAMGVRVRGRARTGLVSLTPQERRVAMLAVDGKRNREIAEDLCVTIKTVEWHLNQTYRKLGIASRVELRRAIRGMVSSQLNPA